MKWHKWVVCNILIGGVLGIVSVAIGSEGDAKSLTIQLREPIHVVSQEGQGLVLPQGVYILEKEGKDSIRMVAVPETDVVVVQATTIKHEEDILTTTALSVREGEDRHHLLLLFPNGTGLETIGSYSGIVSRSRIPRRLSPARVRQRLTSRDKRQLPTHTSDPRRSRERFDSGKDTKRPGVREGLLPQAKILELERQRDRIMKDLQGRSDWKQQLDDLVKNDKNRLEAENQLIANLEKRLKGIRTPAFPDVCKTPQVKKKSVTLPIEPHERIILNGCGFGDERGEVQLESRVFPGGRITLEIQGWNRKVIVAKVPAVKGVKHSRYTILRVIKKDLTLGDPIPMPFKATVSCELLIPSRVTVLCAESGTCGYGGSPSKYKTAFDKKYFGDASFGARHRIAKPFNAGVDQARVALGNGWRLQGMDYVWTDGQHREDLPQHATVGIPKGFKMKARTFTIKMPWASWHGGAAVYGVKLLACGPWGVPY